MSAVESETPPVDVNSIVVTGLIAIAVVLIIAAIIIGPFEHHFFTDWVGLAFMAATPAQVILGLLWHSSKPDFVGKLPQPAKGLALTVITTIAGAVILMLMMFLVGGGHGPTPMLVQYAIMTVVVAIWLVPVWQCWPFSLFTKDPFKVGLLTLGGTYFIAYGLWSFFFDYGFLAQVGHPHYHADIDPSGMFDMWVALVFFVTTAGVIVVHMLFEFWPIEYLTRKLAGGAGQPLRGLIATAYILVVSFVLQSVFVNLIDMDRVDYMIRVPVCMIFGTFLVNNMMQFSLFTRMPQPKRGGVLMGIAIVVAVLMYYVYGFASGLHVGEPLGTGPQSGFSKEIWIASAMLGVTFPIIFMVSGFFGFWPIKRDD